MEKQQKLKKEFVELAKVQIRDNRNLVISKDNLGFITIAQQLVVNEDGRETAVFLKGAIEIEMEYFDNVGMAINQVLEEIN